MGLDPAPAAPAASAGTFRRVLVHGTIAATSLAAGIACAKILTREDGDWGDSPWLVSALALAATGVLATLCDRVRERRLVRPLPTLGILFAAAAAALSVVSAWIPWEDARDLQRPLGTSWALAGFSAHLCLVAAMRLPGRRAWVKAGTGVASALLGILVVWITWSGRLPDPVERAMLVLGVLAIAGTAIGEVWQRLDASRPR